jgi:hypothetical protein
MDLQNTGLRNVPPVPETNAVFGFRTCESGTRAILRSVLEWHEREVR